MTEVKDMLFQIFQELPVKSLMRFKCVSKTWCSVIEDPIFVDSHRLRSHTRPGGISFLICNSLLIYVREKEAIFLLDPEGKLDHIALPKPANVSTWPKVYNHSRHVEGLVCYDNFIWNPSTREAIKIPDQCGLIPFFKGEGEYGILNQYMLGFDAPSRNYKVLSICHVLLKHNYQSHDFSSSFKNQTVAQVLTSGTNTWRNIDCIPEQLRRDSKVTASCCINNIIFFFVSGKTRNTRTGEFYQAVKGLLAFEVGNERFRTIEIPKSPSEVKEFIFEVSGRLGFWDYEKYLWILEDYENKIWTNCKINFQWHNLPRNFVSDELYVEPFGTIHTQEILFMVRSIDDLYLLFFFYYDLDTGKSRFIPRIGSNAEFAALTSSTDLSKHVETLFSFKEG